jgi:hypothetical protein
MKSKANKNKTTIQHWLQTQTANGEWFDWGEKDSPKIAFARIESLKTEQPRRKFRAIQRIISDVILPPNDQAETSARSKKENHDTKHQLRYLPGDSK